MKRFFILLVATVSLFASIESNKKSKILSIDKKEATIEKVNAPIGSSGVVIHHFDKEHATIVAGVELIEPNRVRFTMFNALKQESLPTPNILPKINDEVILNYLYDRGVVIAPNFKTYEEIVKKHPEIEWVHPDLFAAQLSQYQNPAPTKKDFQNFCNKYALGIVYFAIENNGFFVDCQSFKKVARETITKKGVEIQLPFYSRIKEIETSWLNFYGSGEITNYDNYYNNLMESR